VPAHAPRPLAGYKFLIIEDEMMQAWRIGDMLADLGGKVEQIAFNFDQGRQAVMDVNADCAIVDISLNGTLVKTLEENGTPFVFCSAFVDAFDLYPEVQKAPCVGKPVVPEQLKEAVLLALGVEKH
jgi:hypothetical protein